MEADVVGSKGRSTALHHSSDIGMIHRTIGLIPSLDFPTWKIPLPAFQASLPKLVERFIPQPYIMEDARDQKSFRPEKTVSRIKPAR